MTSNNLDAIIFDLDGTLWNATVLELQAINDVIEQGFDIPQITLEQLKNVMGIPSQEAAAFLFPNLDKHIGLEILDKSGDLLDEYIKKCKSDLLYDTVRKTLNILKDNYKLCIVSNCKKGYIETFINGQNICDIFIDFECNGNTGLSKGQNIKLVMKRNKIKNAMYVGDTIKDREASEEAKIPFVYASYGFGKVDAYNYIIHRFDEIKSIITI